MSLFVKRKMIKIREIYKMTYEVVLKFNVYLTSKNIRK